MNTQKQVTKQETVEMEPPRTILFVCTGNTCRSPMAAALLNDMVRNVQGIPPLLAVSAGIMADVGAPIAPHAATALLQAGVMPLPDNDYTKHTARQVTAAMMEQADEVIAITSNHALELLLRFPEYASRIFTLSEDIADPYGGTQEMYQECLAKMAHCLAERFLPGGEQPHEN